MQVSESTRRVIPFVLAALALAMILPFVASGFVLRLATLSAILAIAAIGLNIVMGFTGQISLAHAGLYGVGAYTSGILARNMGLPVWSSMIVGAFAAGSLAIGVGLIAFRTKGIYFIISSLAAQLVATEVFVNWSPVTGGEQGIARIPAPEPIVIPGLLNISFANKISYYYLALLALAVSLYLSYTLKKSRLGRMFIAVREDESLAMSMGVNVSLVKSLSLFISATSAGFAGALYAHYESFINPESFSWLVSADLFIFVFLGGSGTALGPIVGTFLLYPLPEVLRVVVQYRLIVYGLILLATSLLLPKGIVGTFSSKESALPAVLQRRDRGRQLPK